MGNEKKRSFKKCDNCGVQTRGIRIIKGKFLCFNCSQKEHKLIYINGENQVFKEPLSEQIVCFFRLTPSQREKLDNRLKDLFPELKGKKGGLNFYTRALVLSDIGLNLSSKRK